MSTRALYLALVFPVVGISARAAPGFQSSCQEGWDPGFAFGNYPSVPDGPVYASAVFDDGSGPKLYIGGSFGRVGNRLCRSIARWDGEVWSPVGDAWSPNGSGAGSGHVVRALAVYDDGSGPALYAGGHFSTDHTTTATTRVARWDGTSWSVPGGGVNGEVKALLVHDDGTGTKLYIGGTLTTAGGQPVSRIARWDGLSWSGVSTGIGGTEVDALATYDDGTGERLFAAGRFTTAGGVSANHIARWDGAGWSALGAGITEIGNGRVAALHVFDAGTGTKLHVGGYYTEVDGAPASSIAAWDGSSWSTLGSGFNGEVRALTTHDDGSGPALYAGGFIAPPGGPDFGLYRWNGATWTSVGGGVFGGAVDSLWSHDDGSGTRLYAGGDYTGTGGLGEGHLTTWDGANWDVLGTPHTSQGPNGPVLALAAHDDGSGPALFAAGYFGGAGDQPTNIVARWNGIGWSALGLGLGGGPCDALASYDDGTGFSLYAGGEFTSAGSQTVNHIARWDGTDWHDIGGGLGGGFARVAAMLVHDDGSGRALYVAGTFSSSPIVVLTNIARWDGSAWSALGGGLGELANHVHALAVFDDGSGPALYAGGRFGTADGTPVNNIARWNGTSWSALGDGVGVAVTADSVHALCAFDDGSGPALYAGGSFSQASGVTAVGLARWDGTSWSAVPGAPSDPIVYSLRVVDDGSGPALSVGGEFTEANGIPTGGLARWNGTSWSNVGGGPGGGLSLDVSGGLGDSANPVVYAQEFFDDGSADGADLFVGGCFKSAGGYLSHCFARWNTCVETITSFCAGDGSTAACPCSNSGLAGRGCDNSASTGGALLVATGLTNPDTVVLDASGELASALSIFLQGDVEVAPVPFGDGLRCVGGNLKRLYVKSAVGGAVSAPQAGDPSISARSAALGDPIPAAQTRRYQTYYRDADLGFCSAPQGGTFNVSNALAIRW